MDLNKVRNEFIQRLVDVKYDWGYRNKEHEDDVGVLTVKYASASVGIYLEKTLLAACTPETGEQLFDAFNVARNSLAREAWVLWNERLNRIVFRRRLTWRELLDHAGRHKRAALMFALAMARAGAYGELQFYTLPPALSQQKDAVSLPRFDKPGHPDRVVFIQIER
jgi:hypothetical protein